jgi:hypothetical protein
MTSTNHITARLVRASRSLGQAAADRIRTRSRSLQNPQPERLSAACRRGEHAKCYMLNCICSHCNHRRATR